MYRSASRKEMYGKISSSVVSVQTLWGLVGRDKVGLPKMIEICCGVGRESQGGCPALESSVRSLLIKWGRFFLLFSLLFFHWVRVEFFLKTDSGYPKDTGVTLFTLAIPGNPLRYNTHRSTPPVSALAYSRGPRCLEKVLLFLVFESTQLARQLPQERTQMEVQ